MNNHCRKKKEVAAPVPAATTKPWYQSWGRWVLSAPVLALAAIVCAHPAQAQELIYKEDFNTDGEGTRYTAEGRGFVPKNGQVVPVPAGTSYWTRNVDVVAKGEVVGVPFPAPARRATMLFNHALDPAFLTADGKKLLDATIKWLTDGKTNMVVMFSAPHGACETAFGDCYLVDTLTAAGHTVIDDDVTAYPVLTNMITANKVDFIINSSTGGDPIRLANAPVPLLCFASDLAGDMLLATRALVDTTFDPGDVKVEASTHPIAAGLPATFKFVTDAQPFDTVGLGLPPGSITVASYQFTDAAGAVSKHPFLVVTEKGVQLLGGLVSGMEGSGYWAGADLNEPNVSTPPDDPARAGGLAGRSLTLNPVNVTGKPKLKLTFALAGTEVDFDGPGGDDYLSIKVDLNNSGEFIELARYGSPTATEKFLVEMIKGGDGMGGPPDLVLPNYTNRVGIIAKDFTYDIPDGATQLVVRFEALSTFWNEIMAFDNIRITSGDIVTAPGPGNLTGLLGYWRMNETNGTAVSDSSGNGNNGTIINNAAGAWVADSERGQVYRATGTNVIDFGTIIPAMTTSNDFTWSLWIKSDETGTAAAANNNIVFGNRYNPSGAEFNPREFIKFTPSNFEWHFNAAGQNVNYADFVTNQWTHHLVVKQGTNLTYYRDGAASTNGTITGGPTNSQPLYLGGQGTLERWRGLADEVAIFDRALSPTEARQAYDLGKAGESLAPPVSEIPLPAAANLKLWLSADKGVTATAGSVSAWEDQSGNSNNALQTNTGLQPQLVDNAVNNKPAIRFDGDNDYLTVANSPSVAIAGDITTFFVVNFDDFATFRAVWAKTSVNLPAANDWYALPNTGIPRAYRGDGAAANASVDGTTALKAGEYLIVGWDMAGTTLHHYLNGESTGEGQLVTTIADTGKPLLIGTREDLFTKMKGGIAEIIIYDTALSEADRMQVVDYLVSKYGIGTSGGVGPAELGQTVNGFQDDFTGATRDPDWQAFGPGGDHYVQGDGLLYVSPSVGDPNHLLYMKAGYSNNVQEVLARIRVTAFGPLHDYPRGGLAVAVQANPTNRTANPGYNLHFRDATQDNVPSRQFKLLDDARAWGPAGLRTNIPPQTTPGWTNNVWYWLRLRVAPKEDGTNNLYGKVWVADGATAEPTDWQLRWSDSALPKPLRAGFAGIAGSSVDANNNGLGHFEVDYVLIKAAGLPEIKVAFSPTGPPPTVPEFIGMTRLAGNKIQIEWIGAGTLEQADAVTGPYAPVPASSALGIITPSGAPKFYRLRN